MVKEEKIIKKDEIKEIYEKRKNIPTEKYEKIATKIFKNVIIAVALTLYFMILNIAYTKMQHVRLAQDLKVFAGAFLISGLVALEIAYKKDKGTIAIKGVELLILSMHTLSAMHITRLFKFDFRLYVLTSSYIFSIYYILKAIRIYTKERNLYLKSLSDISDIVKKEEPIKKEAKKRNKKEVKVND